jgi:signal transduction histidine kinase
METLFEELRRYVGWNATDEQALRELHPRATPEFARIADVFYARILEHEGARKALVGGESKIGHLKVTLVAWMDKLLSGPWDEAYFELRCRIGRMHVRIALPQHYMFGAMNVVRQELNAIVDRAYLERPDDLRRVRLSLGKILDLELAIMLHTYREDLVAQQARSERLSTFGQLVGSIGHELRNPLGVIESSLYILKSRVGSDERAVKHVGRIADQLGVANGIISALLDMIRDRPLAREPVALGPLATDVLGAVPAPPGVQVEAEGLGDLPAIDADPAQLRQVLRNLVENAVHAVGTSGRVRLAGRTEGGAVEIAVEDSGPGVDPSVRARLFEPLVTTKSSGVGLGLALVRRIVERHGGTVTYAPRDGGGARFVVRLPRGAAHA